MAVTTWTESRTTLEPAGAWGKMPPSYGNGLTWNIPAYDPTKAISTEYHQWKGRTGVAPFQAEFDMIDEHAHDMGELTESERIEQFEENERQVLNP